MNSREGSRIRGLRRWEEWLEGRLSPHGLVREAPGVHASDAVWRVNFQDDTRARVHITDSSLRVNDGEFDVLIDELDQLDWLRLLEAARPGGIRIHADGGIDDLDPEGAERD